MRVVVIKEFPGATIIGEILKVSSDGFIECSAFAVEYLIKHGWVEEYKEKSLEDLFYDTYVSGKFSGSDRLFKELESLANKHYLGIFDAFCDENSVFPMTTKGIFYKMKKLRERLERG